MNSASVTAVCAHVFQQTGRRNQDTEKTCEDVYHILESEDLLFYGLADGQSGALCGAAATVRISDTWITIGIIVASVLLLAAGAAVMLRMEREEDDDIHNRR